MNKIINGERIYIKRLSVEDVTEEYVSWLNNPEINQYLECRFQKHTLEETKSFIESVSNDNNYQFGIFYKENNKHIGDIKIGNINSWHKYADLGFLIGEKDYWGKGIASEAICLVTDFAFNQLKLNKLWGGAYASNIGSIKAFEKNGYQVEGHYIKQYMINGIYVDAFIYAKRNE